MNTNTLATLTMMALMTLASCDDAEKKAIQFSELPQEAQTFVETHFADKQISAIYKDQEIADQDYEVIFTDGANIDFTKNGVWDEVEDRDADGVPLAIIPEAIVTYVNTNHAGQYVVQIGKDGSNYEVELNNTTEMVFDKNGAFLRYDD